MTRYESLATIATAIDFPKGLEWFKYEQRQAVLCLLPQELEDAVRQRINANLEQTWSGKSCEMIYVSEPTKPSDSIQYDATRTRDHLG